MTNIVKFTSLSNALEFVENSGVSDWEWGGNTSAQGFAAYLYEQFDSVDADDYQAELWFYLVSHGENPAYYDVVLDNNHGASCLERVRHGRVYTC